MDGEQAGTVVVTGGTGYVAGWCIVRLLERGYAVRTTVRSATREAAVRAAVASEVDPGDRLGFVVADLTSDDGWDAALDDAEYVLHVASPLGGEGGDPDAIIRPAVDGTQRVLRAAIRSGVRRVVLTSSGAAATPAARGDVVIDDALWTDPEQPGLTPYRASKVLAERAAWDLIAQSGAGTELVTVLPGAIFGPSLPGVSESSTAIITQVLAGRPPAVPRVDMAITDVRDLAQAHVDAMRVPAAAGQRFLATGEVISMRDIAAILRAGLGDRGRRVPRLSMPDWALRLMARFVPPLRPLVPMLGRRLTARSDRAREVLGWDPRPARETVLDTARTALGRQG